MHIYSSCEESLRGWKTKGQLSRRHSYVLMQASATVWSAATFPPHCSGFTAVNLSHTQCWGKRSGRPLSSTPFTKQPLWSEARIRMIMWTPATVYQQSPPQLQLQCTVPTCSLCLSITLLQCEQVHVR